MINAAQTFVRAIQLILKPLKEFADSYKDDSAVHSNIWRDHLKNIEEFLKTMRSEGLTLNLKKHAIKFCGEIIGSGIRKPDPEKVAAIKEMNEPETKRQLRGILGFFSYVRKYIEAFAEKAKVLTDLTAKRLVTLSTYRRYTNNCIYLSKRVPHNIKSLWSEKHSVALQILKRDFIYACESSLHIIRLDRPFEIFVDSSGFAVGGLLCQRDDSGTEYPISFFSVVN